MKKTTGLLAAVIVMLFSAIGVSAAENYAYTVDDVYFTDLYDNKLNGYTDGCMVNVDVTKNSSAETNGLIVLSVYDSENNFTGLYFMKGAINQGEKASFGMSFSMPDGIETGKIKAFVVSNLSTMTPMSAVTSADVSGATTPELDESVKLSSDLIDEVSMQSIYAYNDEVGSARTNYKLSSDFSMYVNDKTINVTDSSTIENYISYSDYVTLVDKYPADGRYEEIRTDYYFVGVVEGVANGKILFDDGKRVDVGSAEECIIKYNDEEKDLSFIQSGDILSVQYDVSDGLTDSLFYNITISRNVVEALFEGRNNSKKTLTFGGVSYKTHYSFTDYSNLILGYDYKLYLDHTGKIYRAVIDS